MRTDAESLNLIDCYVKVCDRPTICKNKKRQKKNEPNGPREIDRHRRDGSPPPVLTETRSIRYYPMILLEKAWLYKRLARSGWGRKAHGWSATRTGGAELKPESFTNLTATTLNGGFNNVASGERLRMADGGSFRVHVTDGPNGKVVINDYRPLMGTLFWLR